MLLFLYLMYYDDELMTTNMKSASNAGEKMNHYDVSIAKCILTAANDVNHKNLEEIYCIVRNFYHNSLLCIHYMINI